MIISMMIIMLMIIIQMIRNVGETDVEPNVINPDTIVADLMTTWPQSIPIFLKHQMSCVGCSMSGFETITDAARIYGIFLLDFLEELQQAIVEE